MKAMSVFLLAVLLLSGAPLLATVYAAGITLSGNIVDGYHIANPGDITVQDNATIQTGTTVLCVATGTMSFGPGFTVESGAVFGAFTGMPSGISDSIDYDNDGMSDYWEFTYFSSLSEDGSGDSDGDGYTNLAEFTYGKNPSNSNSHPNIYSYRYDGAGRIVDIEEDFQ